MIRVLVVDDSDTMRFFIIRLINATPDLQVVGEASNGGQAIELVKSLKPDVITMDVRMPQVNGLEATRQIMATRPTPIIIVSRSINAPDLAIAFTALALGALDVLEKPRLYEREGAKVFSGQLCRSIREMAEVPVVGRRPTEPAKRWPVPAQHDFRIIGIGASTGGPKVLHQLVAALPGDLPCPLLVVQHMAPNFLEGFARWLDQAGDVRVKIAQAGESPSPGTVYVAPQGFHLRIDKRLNLDLDPSPAPADGAGFRPAVDVLFHSLATMAGASAVGVLLSGMGTDGAAGLLAMREAGAWTLAQSSDSCIVDGMPAAARTLGAADDVVSPSGLPMALITAVGYVAADKGSGGSE